jgi:hypothetical protein
MEVIVAPVPFPPSLTTMGACLMYLKWKDEKSQKGTTGVFTQN